MKNELIQCARCKHKFSPKGMIYYDEHFFCPQCVGTFNGRGSCKNQFYCAFRESPAPIPHMVMVEERQDNMVMRTQKPNPKHIKALCIEGECKCCVGEIPACGRVFETCPNYEEIDWKELK